MDVNINFYGHSVDVNEDDIAEGLDDDATDDDIKEAVAQAVDEALTEREFPSYTQDGDDVVEAVREILNARKTENK